jgi:hypothetical protein
MLPLPCGLERFQPSPDEHTLIEVRRAYNRGTTFD